MSEATLVTGQPRRRSEALHPPPVSGLPLPHRGGGGLSRAPPLVDQLTLSQRQSRGQRPTQTQGTNYADVLFSTQIPFTEGHAESEMGRRPVSEQEEEVMLEWSRCWDLKCGGRGGGDSDREEKGRAGSGSESDPEVRGDGREIFRHDAAAGTAARGRGRGRVAEALAADATKGRRKGKGAESLAREEGRSEGNKGHSGSRGRGRAPPRPRTLTPAPAPVTAEVGAEGFGHQAWLAGLPEEEEGSGGRGRRGRGAAQGTKRRALETESELDPDAGRKGVTDGAVIERKAQRRRVVREDEDAMEAAGPSAEAEGQGQATRLHQDYALVPSAVQQEQQYKPPAVSGPGPSKVASQRSRAAQSVLYLLYGDGEEGGDIGGLQEGSVGYSSDLAAGTGTTTAAPANPTESVATQQPAMQAPTPVPLQMGVVATLSSQGGSRSGSRVHAVMVSKPTSTQGPEARPEADATASPDAGS